MKKYWIWGTAGLIVLLIVVIMIVRQQGSSISLIQDQQPSLVGKYPTTQDGTGLPPAPSAPATPAPKEGMPPTAPSNQNYLGKYPDDPSALEKRISVSVVGVMTGYPSQRKASWDYYYTYLIPEEGSYKRRELTLDLRAYRAQHKDGDQVKPFTGKRVKVVGEIYRQFVDPAKPSVVQNVVLVESIDLATASAKGR